MLAGGQFPAEAIGGRGVVVAGNEVMGDIVGEELLRDVGGGSQIRCCIKKDIVISEEDNQADEEVHHE